MNSSTALVDVVARSEGKIAVDNVAHLLFAPNVDINALNDRYSALGWAAQGGNTELVRALLHAGADKELGVRVGSLEIQPIMFACSCGDEEMVALLLQAGAAADCFDGSRCTTLIAATERGNLSVVRRLLDYGAWENIDCIDKSSNWPVRLAVNSRRADILLVLLAAGANARQFANHERLHDHSCRPISRLLLAAGDANWQAEKTFSSEELRAARSEIRRSRVDLIRQRVMQICVGLQAQLISTHELLAIIDHAVPLAQCVPLRVMWDLVCAVRHFHDRVASD